VIVDINVEGKDVLIIGGGTEGTRKVKALLGQGCNITVVSKRVNRYLKQLADEGKISLVKEEVRDASILHRMKRPFIVMATTDDRELNRQLVDSARSMGILAYAADDPSASDFIHPAVINVRDTLFIAISTRGCSPAMARILRIKAERILKRVITEEDIELIRLADYARRLAMRNIDRQDVRKSYIYSVINDKEIAEMVKGKRLDDARRKIESLLKVYTV
jgi:precorrin-2 dehydrogenase/sirohydrochlorin ferrochelatase